MFANNETHAAWHVQQHTLESRVIRTSARASLGEHRMKLLVHTTTAVKVQFVLLRCTVEGRFVRIRQTNSWVVLLHVLHELPIHSKKNKHLEFLVTDGGSANGHEQLGSRIHPLRV